MLKRNGIPAIGLGTYPLKGDEAYGSVRSAIDLGYRHIDTAQMYGNEAEVGRAIKECRLARSDFFVTTKVDPSNANAALFAKSVTKSVEVLGGPVDLLLIHWPPADTEMDAMLDLLVEQKIQGNTKSIGVSNFSPSMVRNAVERTQGAIICNQIEFHPLLDQSKLLATARELGLALEAYSPIARGAALKSDVIVNIAKQLERPPSEIVLRWIIQQGVVPIPMTTKKENAASNLRALDFELSELHMQSLAALSVQNHRTVNPSYMAGRW